MSANATIRLLSIDDRTVTTDLDRAGYRKMGVLVKAAANYEEARNYLDKGNIDIIVINMDYAGVDAAQATMHLKSQSEYDLVPIVLTSVQTSAAIRNLALSAGADLFVEQPLPRSYFIEKLKGLLEQQTRSTSRFEIQSDVQIEFNDQSRSWPLGDLSSSGLLLSTDENIEDGTKVVLKFNLPGVNQPIKASGEVVRTIEFNKNHPDRPTGVGIRFVGFTGDSENRLAKFIAINNDTDNQMRFYL